MVEARCSVCTNLLVEFQKLFHLKMDKLTKIASKPENQKCFECAQISSFVNLDLYTFVCSSCAGLLIELQFVAKSISATKFTDKQIELFEKIGNKVQARVWLGKWDAREYPEPDGSNLVETKKWLRKKYIERAFYVPFEDEDEFGEFQDSAHHERLPEFEFEGFNLSDYSAQKTLTISDTQNALLALDFGSKPKKSVKERSSDRIGADLEPKSLLNPFQNRFFGSYTNIHNQKEVESGVELLQVPSKSKNTGASGWDFGTNEIDQEDEFSEFQTAPCEPKGNDLLCLGDDKLDSNNNKVNEKNEVVDPFADLVVPMMKQLR
jgi:hypothetical protein